MTAPFHPPLDDGDTTRLTDGFGGEFSNSCPECDAEYCTVCGRCHECCGVFAACTPDENDDDEDDDES